MEITKYLALEGNKIRHGLLTPDETKKLMLGPTRVIFDGLKVNTEFMWISSKVVFIKDTHLYNTIHMYFKAPLNRPTREMMLAAKTIRVEGIEEPEEVYLTGLEYDMETGDWDVTLGSDPT